MRIKCPHCNGKGFSELNSAVNMTCGWCMGQGELDLEIVPTEQQTNEEWLRSCPPQELIRFLMNVAYGGQIRSVQKRTFCEEAEKWSKWLKEKHTE